MSEQSVESVPVPVPTTTIVSMSFVLPVKPEVNTIEMIKTVGEFVASNYDLTKAKPEAIITYGHAQMGNEEPVHFYLRNDLKDKAKKKKKVTKKASSKKKVK